YTGKGVKIGVIDTGIDLLHPDLVTNYAGGYDVVDFDDEPAETTGEPPLATAHGTHVSGIIAANGALKGIAPEASLYAYRALGPGGIGTSAQVIAALEEAVKDGMDIVNLSLGNMVNAPDYPTSKAVDEAAKLGTIVVVANGNAGPATWTVGAPATAEGAIAVGAYEHARPAPFLHHPLTRKKLALHLLPFSSPWLRQGDIEVVLVEQEKSEDTVADFLPWEKKDPLSLFHTHDQEVRLRPIIGSAEKSAAIRMSLEKEHEEPPSCESDKNRLPEEMRDWKNYRKKVAYIEIKSPTFLQDVESALLGGASALIINPHGSEDDSWVNLLESLAITIPVARLSQEDGAWLKENMKTKTILFRNEEEEEKETVALFSSRGPVTGSWAIKPDLLAPGVN